MSDSAGEEDFGRRIGLLIPARNESLLLSRKCHNTARLDWPKLGLPPGLDRSEDSHRVVIVDDDSSDGTGELARELIEQLGHSSGTGAVKWSLVRGQGLGKARAIKRGLSALGEVDLVVLSDVDVILRQGSLVAFDQAFRGEPELALACGAQEFVRDLHSGGSERAADGGPLQPAGELFDRVTAKVRSLESQSGRVFSVHGQLLAWRADLGLTPTPGLEADDIDLMCAARQKGGRVRLIQGARFLEVKPEPGELRKRQRERRAAGYFQVLEFWRGRRPLGDTIVDRAQWVFYVWAPRLAPYLLLSLLLGLAAMGFEVAGWRGVLGVTLLFVLAAATAVGREVASLALLIDKARRNAAGTFGDPGFDRWEPPRSTG